MTWFSQLPENLRF